MNRYFDLYLTAGHSVPVVINCNQYDSSETWIFTLYTEDDQLYTPASGSIVGLKSDGHTIANAGTVNNDGQVVIQETVQITAAKGINVFELVLDGNHGTANFVVLVEPRPGDNVTPSDSELTLMEQAIAAAGSIGSVSALTDIVNSVNSRMDEFIADHAGLSSETVLWTGELYKTYVSPATTPTGGKATLSQNVTDFDYIGVYTTMNTLGDDQTAEVHWYNADDFAENPTMVTCGTTKAYSSTTDWVAIPYITLLMDSDEVTCTVFNAGLVSWNGHAESNAASQTSEGTTNYQGSVVKIVGIKNTQNDTEVIDARVGADGTVYNTLEARLNAENSALKSAIASGSSLTSAIKSALLQLAQKVAYIDEDGQDYYDDLYDALYPPVVYTAITLNTNSLSFGALNTTQTLTATTTPSGGAVTWSSSNTSVATVSQTGVVTSVGYGNATITATCGNLSATCSVAITQATVTSISAVFNQVGVTVYSTDTLDSLKAHLTVRATYSDSSTVTLDDSDYTLSGTLTVGTSTITVSYGGQTTTFTVDVTDPYALQWMVEYRGNFTTSTAGTNRVTLISSNVHFEPGDVKTATIAQGYKFFPISESATGSDTSLNRTPKGTNNIYVTTEWGNTTTDSKGKIVVGTTAPVLLSTNTWVQNGGSCSFTYSSEKTTWYTLGGLSFYVDKVDGSEITVAEAEAALTIE